MSEETKNPFGDTGLGILIGVAVVVLSLCLGVGSCNAIQAVAYRHADQDTEAVQPDAKTQTEAIAGDSMATIAVEESEKY